MTDQDVRARMYAEQQNAIEQDITPFEFMNDTVKKNINKMIVMEVWTPVTVRKW